MEIRKAVIAELEQVIEVIESGRAVLSEREIPQWQNGDGPNAVMSGQDILAGECYILEAEGEVAGTAVLTAKPDPAYDRITAGEWLGAYGNYISIHRVAVKSDHQGKGYAKRLLLFLLREARQSGYRDIRIDTHPDNKVMQRTVESVGFRRRGIVLLDVSNGERIAYQIQDC